MSVPSRRLTIAIGPEFTGWGSWDWVGRSLVDGLGGRFITSVWKPWETPEADIVVLVKHLPPAGWAERVARDSALVFCPVDVYGSASAIVSDADWLRRCSLILVHSRRLMTYFSSLAETAYIDHPIKYAAPMRESRQQTGSLLWVGVRTNIPPLADWLDRHPLPLPLDILTNPEHPGDVLKASAFGFRAGQDIRIHNWSPGLHVAMTRQARAAFDIKGDDFRSRHKPPAKLIDFVASGIPVAINPGSGPGEHLAALGLNVPSPLDERQWLSESYWLATRQAGRQLLADLSPSSVAGRAGQMMEEAWFKRNIKSAPTMELSKESSPKDERVRPAAIAAFPGIPKLYGLMITKDDESVFGDWCDDQLPLYDAVVCLDGSDGGRTAEIAARHAEKLIYLRERDFIIPHRTNQGLRAIVCQEIVKRFGTGHWVMLCHPDEFAYHDPRKIAAWAQAGGFDSVRWFAPQFYPHPSELAEWADTALLPIYCRQTHYHWDHGGSGFPWMEDRLFHLTGEISWNLADHRTVKPNGLHRPAPYCPILRHFKVVIVDPAWYEVAGDRSVYSGHWQDVPHRAGLPFAVSRLEDFFVSDVPGFGRCDRFADGFPHSWNMGDHFLAIRPIVPNDSQRQQYQLAQTLALEANDDGARLILDRLRVSAGDYRLRALAINDLAAIQARAGDRQGAVAGFLLALRLHPECGPARQNLEQLGAADRIDHSGPTPAESARPEPVRVAILSLLFNWPSTGGGTVHTTELAKFLALDGYDVRHFYARHDGWGIGRVVGHPPHPAVELAFDESTWNAASIQARFREAVQGFDPDAVIVSDSWNFKPLLADAVRPYPVILRLQALECLCPLNNIRLRPAPPGPPRQCPLHQLARPDACAECVRENDRSSGDLHRAERALSGVGTPEYREIFFRAFAESRAVLVVNPLTEAMVSPYAPDVRVVTAGMDPARFPPPAAERDRGQNDRIQILFAGLTSEWIKGFHVLFEACENLWRRRKDFELIVTDSSRADYARDFIRFVGWQSQSDLPRHFHAADIVAVPAVAQEALGRTAVEGMAAGRPVLASRLGGLPFTVPDGSSGILFEPGNVADLIAKLAMLLDDPELRKRLGLSGRRRFEEHYAWPMIIHKHYRPLLRARSRGKMT
ncbi:glycosyltransferase family 4 protein [Zavarzinella formosa]|uniref:glycosyltransferase family 4 protein n=1 Tax=Zavarzinella formosa TaxID=360055 RepID=UPI0002FD4DF0|nr:glycosyltransferase family 4 protein [Zavarzinella formosa]